ncbi:PAS domain-containing sensor histidine kinase [Halorussus halobius]|uniref:PAS domain-containing sensor histidine kinase n=1 Tax=Halorussus halobius TaxID=1710537 RepID=UPI0010930DE3|nr:PAS domain-containing sensor histidine kinase [Halorussus halobius]
MTSARSADDERFAAYFHAAPDAIVVVDDGGNVVRANDRVTDLFGYEPSELQGEPVERLVPECNRDGHAEKVDSYVDDPRSRPMGAGLSLRARRKDGSTFPVDISLSPLDADDGSTEVMAVVRDISERERLQRKYRTLLETAPDAAFVVSAETGEVLEVNERATELIGAPEDDLVGRTHTDLHPSGQCERYRDLFGREFDPEGSVFGRLPDGSDLRIETTDGEYLPVEMSLQDTDLNDRRVVIALVRDISERRAYERDLKRQLDRFKELSHVLSHDLRNPLNVAEGYVEVARERGDVSCLEHVEDAHTRMADILEDTLAIIRKGYGAESLEPVELESVAAECWRYVETPTATLHVESSRVVEADPRRVDHVFENLFSNAVEHAGTDATVRVGALEDGFFVADDGPGIPPTEREAVFEYGYTTSDDGTGLGLNIVAEIVDAHGWSISVAESREGGTRFEITGIDGE